MRGLRRMRAGLPDRCARARARRVSREGGSQGLLGLPVLWRRLSADLSRRRRAYRARRGTRRSGEPRAAVREGPLRLRLRDASAPADEADDPSQGRAEERRLHRRSCQSALRVPRGFVGRGDGARGRDAGFDPRHARPARARRASDRRRAATRRRTCSRSWCAPASGRTMSITARDCATRRAWRRCWKGSDRPRCRTR